MLSTKGPFSPMACLSTWMVASEYVPQVRGNARNQRVLMTQDQESISVYLGMMWAKPGSELVMEALQKVKAMWSGSRKRMRGKDNRNVSQHKKGWHQNHQRLLENEYARTGKVTILPPWATSPFPRWIPDWRKQLDQSKVSGVVLPTEHTIISKSFTCNAWSNHWNTRQSIQLCEWVESMQSKNAASVIWSTAPCEKLYLASGIVAKSVPHLTESGVPVAIALHTTASAIESIGRSCPSNDSLVQHLPVVHLALGFIVGALSVEWIKGHGGSCGATVITVCLEKLLQRFGVAPHEWKHVMSLNFQWVQ